MSNQGPIGFGDPNDEELPTFAGMPGDPLPTDVEESTDDAVTFIEPDAVPSLATQLVGTGISGSLVAGLTASLSGSGCAALEFAAGGRPGVILINVSTALDAGRRTRCVAREFASNLGLPGRLDRPGSVFGPSGPVAGFAPRDLVLLRMLYDPRLRNGMGAAEARPLLPAVAAAALAP